MERKQQHVGAPVWAERLQTVAFFLLLTCVVTRPFMAEMTYDRSSALKGLFAAEMTADQRQPDRTDLSRSVFAALTLLAAAVWALGAGLSRRTGVPSARLLSILLTAFVVLASVSVLFASNKRLAMTGWLEQSTLLLTGFLALQLCRARWRFVVVLVVLGALAFTASAKGLWEVFVEIPIKVAQWEEDPAGMLRRMEIAPDSPQAIAVEARATESTPAGFNVMANVFASLLLVLLLAVVGAALAKLNQARTALPAFLATRKKGELPADIVLAATLAMLAVPLATLLVLTRSRGGIIAAAVALAAFAIVFRFRHALAARWKKALLAAGGVFLALLLAVVTFGLVTDRLPTKTMTFRWMYWTATAKMIADQPLTGVGAGNFGAAYVTVRDVRGEEAVKNPHNVIVHALAEFGAPAGAAFLAVIGAFLVLSARPRDAGVSCGAGVPPACRGLPSSTLTWLLLATVPAVGLARAYFSFSPGLFDAGMWVTVFAVGAAGAFFVLRSLAEPDADLSPVRVALGVACVAFVLHDLINFAFFQPATAAVFWLTLGAAASRGAGVSCGAGVPPAPRAAPMLILSTVFFALLLATVATQVSPVWQRTVATGRMLGALYDRQPRQALVWAGRAADADPLDPVAAADAARLSMTVVPDSPAAATRRALTYADQAVARDPRHAKVYMLRAAVLGDAPAALDDWQHAVDLDPQNARMRLEFATRLPWSDLADLSRALEQLRQADRADAGLFDDSNERLNPTDRARLDALFAAARQAVAGAERRDAQAIESAAAALNTVAPRQREQLLTLAQIHCE